MKRSKRAKKAMVTVRQGTQKVKVEKPTVWQAAWVVQQMAGALKSRPSFRQFIYGTLGYPRPEEPGSEATYVILYLAGGMELTNTVFDLTEAKVSRMNEIVSLLRLVKDEIAFKTPGAKQLEKLLAEYEKWLTKAP